MALAAGTRHYSRNAMAEKVADGIIAFGRILVVVAAAVVVLWLL